jgi:hypothetical protein
MYQVVAEGVYGVKPKMYTKCQSEGVYVAKLKVYNEYQLKVCTWRSQKCTTSTN